MRPDALAQLRQIRGKTQPQDLSDTLDTAPKFPPRNSRAIFLKALALGAGVLTIPGGYALVKAATGQPVLASVEPETDPRPSLIPIQYDSLFDVTRRSDWSSSTLRIAEITKEYNFGDRRVEQILVAEPGSAKWKLAVVTGPTSNTEPDEFSHPITSYPFKVSDDWYILGDIQSYALPFKSRWTLRVGNGLEGSLYRGVYLKGETTEDKAELSLSFRENESDAQDPKERHILTPAVLSNQPLTHFRGGLHVFNKGKSVEVAFPDGSLSEPIDLPNSIVLNPGLSVKFQVGARPQSTTSINPLIILREVQPKS